MTTFRIRSLGLRSLTVAGAVALAGCAGGLPAYGPGTLRAGDSAATLRERMGAPTEQIRRADGGERWVYARGPMGRHTWMIDVTPDGRVSGWFQALEPSRLASITRGMSEADVRAAIGPPAEQRRLALEGRRLLSWRYPTYDCLLFAVTLNAIGQVIDVGTIPDPLCDVEHA
jgi:hypothetical protein